MAEKWVRPFLKHHMGRSLLQDNGTAPIAAPPPAMEPDIVEVYSFNAALMVVLIILWSSFGHQIARRTKYMGEGSAACAMGLITGSVILISQRYFSTERMHELLTFNPAGFFTYLLPPIIFYAGLSVKKKQFFRNFISIASFGIVGTYIAFAIIAYVLYGFSKLPNILTLPDCLALGVIFAATDSVAVLQVLKQDKMPLLYSLVFGEGVINDATSVALLRAVQALDGTEELNAATVLLVLGKFVYLFLASMGLGLAFGLGTSLLMKIFKSHSTPQEVALVGLLGYLSYLCGELLGLSGIVTVFCCAVAISHYALHNVSSMSRVTIVSAFQTLSYLSEGAIFIYVGMDLLDPLKWRNSRPLEVIWLFCVLLLLMVLGRAAFVFPLSYIHNRWSKDALSVKEMIVIWWSGLIRGAVSVALVYYYFDPNGKAEDEKNSTLITTTLLEVMTSIFVFGAATKPLLDSLLGSQVVLERDNTISMELMAGRRRGQTPSARSQDGGVARRFFPGKVQNTHQSPFSEIGHNTHGRQSVGPSNSNSSDGGSSPRRFPEGGLMGSHGQNLSDLAENLPPAMAVHSQTKWGPTDKYDPGDAWLEENEGRHSPIMFGNEGPDSGRAGGGESSWQDQEGFRWNSAKEEEGAEMAPLNVSTEEDSRGLVERRSGFSDQARNQESPGPLHNWWLQFDAQYMQPVFGGAHGVGAPASVELHRRNSRSPDDNS